MNLIKRTPEERIVYLEDRISELIFENAALRKQLGETVSQRHFFCDENKRHMDQLAALQELLRVAKCPNCGGAGYTVRADRFGEPEQEQCQWCFEQSAALAGKEKA